MVEKLFESHSCIFNTITEIFGSLFQKFVTFFQSNNVLLCSRIDALTLFKNFDSASRSLREHFPKFVSRPFNAMKCLFREHLKGAVRNFRIILGVLLRTIAFCQFWQDDLHMTLWSKSSTFEKRCLGCHATSIDVKPRLDIVESICHNC